MSGILSPWALAEAAPQLDQTRCEHCPAFDNMLTSRLWSSIDGQPFDTATTMMGLGAIVGTGIFVSVGYAAGVAGDWIVAAIGIAAIVATVNGLSSAQLAAAHPVSGGTYEGLMSTVIACRFSEGAKNGSS